MQDTNGNIAHRYFDQHEDGDQDVLIDNQTIDLPAWVDSRPITNSDHQRVDTCYGE